LASLIYRDAAGIGNKSFISQPIKSGSVQTLRIEFYFVGASA